MHSTASPVVSVVIPTVERPELLLRAVHSALQQTFRDLEVIVVFNREEKDTVTALESISSPRLRLLPFPKRLDGSRARNEGARAARGEWVAFLDDDDLWIPEKLERQLALAWMSDSVEPIIACKVTA